MARLLMMTDFSELYARQLLQGIVRYSDAHSPWVVRKLPLSLRDSGRLAEAADFAVQWKADAIIGQFRRDDPVELFRERGILTFAQDYEEPFGSIPNISGDYALSGKLCADFFIRKGVTHFGFFGLKGMVWSEERRDSFLREVQARVSGATGAVLEIENDREMWWYDQDLLCTWLKGLPKPAAILACDDNRAYSLVEAARQLGEEVRIPDDVLVLGVDNDESVCALCVPPLSSLGQDVEDAGYRTAQQIDCLLGLPLSERFDRAEDIRVAPTFVTSRLSTAARIYDNPHVSRVVTYIQSHLNGPILVDDLVETVPLSRRTLYRVFKQETGMPLHQYVHYARVERMKELMETGYSPVQAAAEIGSDYKHIAKPFKTLTGISPAEYARTLKS